MDHFDIHGCADALRELLRLVGDRSIVAIGDVHGAYDNFVQVLQMAGLVDEDARWVGGTTHLVQTGDVLDRGKSLRPFSVRQRYHRDLYPRFGPTMEWDTAAGHAIVEAAGGTVLTVDGSPLHYNKKSLLNPYFIVKGK